MGSRVRRAALTPLSLPPPVLPGWRSSLELRGEQRGSSANIFLIKLRCRPRTACAGATAPQGGR